MASLSVVLTDCCNYNSLLLGLDLDPMTWRALDARGIERSLADHGEAEQFFSELKKSYGVPCEAIYVSVEQDGSGQHHFINLGQASDILNEKQGAGASITLVPESDAKNARENCGAMLLYAREACEEDSAADSELCAHGWASNYSVVPELSLGRTQKLLLSDESTLMRDLPEERIFEFLTLIVNCHESNCSSTKYKIGSCKTDKKPKVICQAVHGWFNQMSEINRINDEIQIAIYEGLQTGSVAVHCLAGIHRAACIVACHFLWRHYVNGESNIPCDATEIYRRLQSVRPHVSPAYTHVLRSYENYLKNRSQKQI